METAQVIVDNLAQRRGFLVWAEGEIVRVLEPSLPYRDQVLLVLHHLQPDRIEDGKLLQWVEYSNPSRFRDNVLEGLHKEALIDYRNGKARILPPGNTYVETELRGKGLHE